MILGPDDPRAITGKAREDAEAYTEWFNEQVLGMKPRTRRQKADMKARLERVLREIDYPNSKDPA